MNPDARFTVESFRFASGTGNTVVVGSIRRGKAALGGFLAKLKEHDEPPRLVVVERGARP